MAKLGEQLKEQQEQQQQGRETRKQRVAKKQAEERAERERIRFENLRKQAKEIQETKFKDRTETYTEQQEIPDWSKIPWRFERKWDNYSSSVKANLMKTWRREGKTKTVTVTKTRTIPFTLEDGANSYRSIYEGLSDDLKQFFDTPAKVLENKAERIAETKEQIAQKKIELDAEIKRLNEKYDKKEKSNREWYRRKQKKYSGEKLEKYRDRYKERDREIDDDRDEAIAEVRGEKKGLDEGLSQLGQNKDITFDSIWRYARDVGNYEESKEEARNERKMAEWKQSYEIAKLEGKGYTPQIIQKFDKGNPTAVELSYYNKETGDWQKVKEFKADTKVDVAGMEKLGFSERQERTLTYGGKDFKFKSAVGIYKDKKGNVVTPYGKTGFTEQELIKEAQDKAYSEWEEKNKNNVGGGFVELKEGKELPFGYGGQQTVQYDGSGNIKTPSILLTEKEYYLQDQKQSFNPLSYAWDKTKQGLGWIDDRTHWDFNIGGSPSMPKVNIVSFGLKDEETLPETSLTAGAGGVDAGKQNIEEWVVGKENIEELDTKLEDKYSGQYQTEFERQYMKDLIYEKTDFETASKEFAESDEAKVIQKKYAEEYGEEYKDLQTFTKNPLKSDFWVKNVAGGGAMFGLNIASLGISAVKTPFRAVGTAGAVVTGVKALSLIPPAVNVGVLSATGGYGLYKGFSPESTYIESGAGLITAGISFGTLGYMGYRHLRSPVVKRVTIKPPKANLKATSTTGKDITVVKDGVVKANKVVYNTQKLSQVGTKGYRTIVTTKGRVLSNKFWRYIGVDKKFTTLDSNAIYRGVPTQQLGKTYYVKGLRGSYKYTVGKSGYQKAFDLMRKYYPKTVSDASIKAQLRYTAPRVYEQYLKSGTITIGKGGKATATFEHLTKRPVIDVDKTLGIKTRGGADYKTLSKIDRTLVADKTGNVYAKYEGYRISGFVDKSGNIKDWKEFELLSGKTKVFASGEKKGYEYLGKVKVQQKNPIKDFTLDDFPEFLRGKYKDVEGFIVKNNVDKFKAGEIYVKKGLTGKARKEVIAHEQGHAYADDIAKLDAGNKKILKDAVKHLKGKYGKVPDAYKGKEIQEYYADVYAGKVKSYNLEKYRADAPYQDLYSISRQDAWSLKLTKWRNQITANINYDPKTINIQTSNAKLFSRTIDLDKIRIAGKQSFNPTDDISVQLPSQQQVPRSDLDKVMNRMDDFRFDNRQEFKFADKTAINVNQQELVLKSPLQVDPINVVKVKNLLIHKDLLNVGVGVKTLTATSLLSATQMKHDVKLKHDMDLKHLLKTDVQVKTEQVPAIKTATALKTQLKSIIDLTTVIPNLNTPTFRPPRVPTIRQPTPIPPFIKFPLAKGVKGGLKAKIKKSQQYAYLPDFTSRALGLKAVTVSEKQAKKKLKKILTGLEIRRGVIVK